jgi:hypothetical protein
MKTPVFLDGGGDVYDLSTHPPHAHAREDAAFPMFVEWKPSPHLATLVKQAGLSVPDSDAFNAAVGEFIAYWLTQSRMRTQHEWDHALVKALKGSRLQASRKPPPKRRPQAENFDTLDYGPGGKL